MAATAPQVMYRDEYVAGYENRKSILRDWVTTETMTKGASTNFLVSKPNRSAVTRGANGLIPAAVDDLTQVPVVLAERHDKPQKTKFNIFTGQSDQRRIMQTESIGVINRDTDLTIIAGLNTGTVNTGAAAVMSKALVNKAAVKLWAAKVPNDGTNYGLLTPAAWAYLSDVVGFSSSDYVSGRPLERGPEMKEWMGIKWMMHTDLPGMGTNAAKCFIWNKSAIGHALASSDIEVFAGYNEEDDYSWARTTFYHGVSVIQNSGIVVINHDDSAYA